MKYYNIQNRPKGTKFKNNIYNQNFQVNNAINNYPDHQKYTISPNKYLPWQSKS